MKHPGICNNLPTCSAGFIYALLGFVEKKTILPLLLQQVPRPIMTVCPCRTVRKRQF